MIRVMNLLMVKMVKMVKSGGNTKPQILTSETAEMSGNVDKKRISVGKKWCFTLNNWCEDNLVKMVKDFEVFGVEYIIGEEVGECGTPHLQGAIFGEKYFRYALNFGRDKRR